MKTISLLALFVGMISCSSQSPVRDPAAAAQLAGTYLGEADYSKRTVVGGGMRKPAIRIYLQPIKGEFDSYHAVLMEYDHLEAMAAPYLAAQKAPALNKVIGYLDKIASQISAYKVTPSSQRDVYEMRSLLVENGQIVPDNEVALKLKLSRHSKEENALAGATITGPEGEIRFPSKDDKQGFFKSLKDAVTLSQYELAVFTYNKAHLSSTWRGDWENLVGSYLSEYGKLNDGVLELMADRGQRRAKFMKSKITAAKNFTNPKSAELEGEFMVNEAQDNMFVMSPVGRGNTASDQELSGRIGLFLDIFDASAPEAGGHLVVELALVNPKDPSDFLMYYEHPEHKKDVGVDNK